MPDSGETLPDAAELALAWTPPSLRPRLRAALELDQRLGRIVARTTEPMLGQMRLAWWRDALNRPVTDRPRGDTVLDALGVHWAGRDALLIDMVDGWETLVTAERLEQGRIEAFAARRGAFFTGIEVRPGAAPPERLNEAGSRWALADAAAGVSDPQERALMVAAGLSLNGPRERLPRSLRGLAVLDALALRALRRGGRALIEGRGASLVAWRAALLGA